MNKISQFMDEKLNPIFGKFAELPFVSALNKAFMALLPLIMLGAFSTLFAGFAIPAYQEFISSTGILNALLVINNLTLNLYGVWLAGSLGYYYANRLGLKNHSIILIFVSIFSFFLITPYVNIEKINYLPFTYLGSRGLFSAMVITVLTVRVYKFCIDKNIYLKMPAGVPAFIQDSFAGLIPALIVSIICLVLQNVIVNVGYSNVNEFIYTIISLPLSKLTSSPVSIIILLTLPSLFWFFGIHGGAATAAIIPPLLMPLAMENAAAYAAGSPVPHMFAMGIMNLTGASTVVWAVFCIMSNQERFKQLGKLALVPSLFGVTEPFNFGIPLVLNPYLFIPQLLLPLVNLLLLMFFMSTGILPYAHSMYVWGIPLFFSGFIQSGIMGVVFQALLLVVDFIIIYPFFKAYEKSCLKVVSE